MAVNYDPTLDTDQDRVRFHLQDTRQDEGPRPQDRNFDDGEISAIITLQSTWQSAVAALLDVLAIEWSRYADTQIGPRGIDYAQIAVAYAKRAKEWRKQYSILPGAHVAGVIRVDGYSDDVASDDVDTASEYARVKIRTWEYPL